MWSPSDRDSNFVIDFDQIRLYSKFCQYDLISLQLGSLYLKE